MELVNLLKEEIKRLASEENINVPKLTEYTRIYERLRAFDTTSVTQVVSRQDYMFDQMIPRMQTAPVGNEVANMFDIIKEIAYDFSKPKGRYEIDEYMFWLGFLKDVKKDIKNYPMTDKLSELWDNEINNLTYKLYERTVGLMKKQLKENIEKETNEIEKEIQNKLITITT